MLMSRVIFCIFASVVFSFQSMAQDSRELQDRFLEAEYFLMNEDYQDALPIYLQLYEILPDNANLAHSIGICYLNIQGRKNFSVSYLESAVKNMSVKHREGSIKQNMARYDALYDLARAYRINYMFEKARETYQRYYETLLPEDRENRKFITHEMEVCGMAAEMVADPVAFSEENVGEIFNDENANFNPVISSDGKSFAYMVKMKFYDAVMFSRNVNGRWTDPVNITPELQSDGDFYISALSADGKMLLLSKNDDFNSDIYVSTYNGKQWSNAVILNKNINTRYWESQAFISDNGEKLIFSSDRPGGFGGLDLYVSVKTNGDWGPAQNMGPEINTEFNEDRPFLINNGKTLFFISQGHENMGGYDIFKSELQSNKLWSKPANIGYPINTPDDNFFFNPAGTGNVGYYSVYRETGGFGNEDIYRITFK
jgi:tetratricopeptide (TPR) repeat protein